MTELPHIGFKKDTEQTIEFEIAHLPRLFQETPPDHDPLKSHRLNFYAVILVTDGSPGTHYIDFDTYEYQKDSLIFIAKDCLRWPTFVSLSNHSPESLTPP